MPTRSKRWLAAPIVFAMTIACAGLVAFRADSQEKVCQTFDLGVAPKWISNSAWRYDESQVVVVDGIEDLLRVYTPNGKSIPSIGRAGKYRPTRIQRTSDGFLLEQDGDRFLRIEENFAPRESEINLRGRKNGHGLEIGTINGWSFAEDVGEMGTLIAFGFLKEGEGWFAGFMSIPLHDPDAFHVLERCAHDDVGASFYLLGLDLFTYIEGRGAFILSLLGDEPQLLATNRDLTSIDDRLDLNGISSRFKRNVGLTIDNRSEAIDQFNALRDADLATGIYSYDRKLLVLRRYKDQYGVLSWELVNIDYKNSFAPSSNPIVLPEPIRGSQHLSILPGKDWIFVLKGDVIDVGHQKIEKAVRVPGEWLMSRAIQAKGRDYSEIVCQP